MKQEKVIPSCSGKFLQPLGLLPILVPYTLPIQFQSPLPFGVEARDDGINGEVAIDGHSNSRPTLRRNRRTIEPGDKIPAFTVPPRMIEDGIGDSVIFLLTEPSVQNKAKAL